jgi:hypothetical protein
MFVCGVRGSGAEVRLQREESTLGGGKHHPTDAPRGVVLNSGAVGPSPHVAVLESRRKLPPAMEILQWLNHLGHRERRGR